MNLKQVNPKIVTKNKYFKWVIIRQKKITAEHEMMQIIRKKELVKFNTNK